MCHRYTGVQHFKTERAKILLNVQENQLKHYLLQQQTVLLPRIRTSTTSGKGRIEHQTRLQKRRIEHHTRSQKGRIEHQQPEHTNAG